MLIQEVHRVIKDGGLFLVTTPNLAWWLNRIVLLFGYQPYWTETSYKYNVGKLKRTFKAPQSGHLRSYTLKALKELLQLYGFNVLSTKGVTYNEMPSGFKLINALINKKVSQAEIIVLLAQKKAS